MPLCCGVYPPIRRVEMSDEPLVVVAFRIPQSVRDWLRMKGEEEERSVNFIGRRLFEKAMQEEQKEAA